jgi:Flp pilus assembly protein TadG
MARRVRRERGAAAVEFAILVPLLLLLIFGIISYGVMLAFRQSLSQAASEAARAAVGAPSAQVNAVAQSAVKGALDTYGKSCSAGVACTISTPAPCAGDSSHNCVQVTVTYPYRGNPIVPTVPGLGFTLPATLSFTSSIEVS